MGLGERLLRPGRSGPQHIRIDLLWLFGFALLAIATGIGLRDPWPPDEPRFALVARDMVATGQWLIPQIGGDVYADKPPLFFWIVGACYWLTGSLRIALLLPGFLAALGVLACIYDLARRLWDRTTGLAAGLALLGTVQFVWQARQGQIDATLCFWTTLGFYGLMRHLLLGPAWRWYFVGWAAAGFGIITKGVGFLPLLVLIPYGLLRASGWIARPQSPQSILRWWLGPLAMLAAIGVWLAPMLFAAYGDPALAAYRDEILFSQTIDRYASAWHHQEPFWYFVLQVIPIMWLPLIALLPWLQHEWRCAFRARDARIWLPLGCVVLVLLFFSLSSGKRGVYVLPAAPVFVLACAPFLVELSRRRGPRNAIFGLACALAVIMSLGAIYGGVDTAQRLKLLESYDIDIVGPLLAMGLAAAAACALARPRRAFVAWGGVLAAGLLVVSFRVNPAMNDARSGVGFMNRVQSLAPEDKELGLISYKEQYLLHLARPATNFGHSRWREFDQEAADAAAWLAVAPERRVLLVDQRARKLCFADANAVEVGMANRIRWALVSGRPAHECIARGKLDAARVYVPPRR